MKIDIHNYEAYALDYLEDNISQDDKIQFEYFLNDNPEIAKELFNINIITVPTPNIQHPNIQSLQKKEEKSPLLYIVLINGIAASILIAAFLFILQSKETSLNSEYIVATQSSKISQASNDYLTQSNTNTEILNDINPISNKSAFAEGADDKPTGLATDPVDRSVKYDLLKADQKKEFNSVHSVENELINTQITLINNDSKNHASMPIITEDIAQVDLLDPLDLNSINSVTYNDQIIETIYSKDLKIGTVNIGQKPNRNNRLRIKINLVDRLSDFANNQMKEALVPEYLASN